MHSGVLSPPITLLARPVTSLDVLIAQMCARSAFKPCCFLVLSDFLWQSVPGSAYSLCENGSSLLVLNSGLPIFIICFLFSCHKGWKKRDSQSIVSQLVIILRPFVTSLFFLISPSAPDSLPFRYTCQILGTFSLTVCSGPSLCMVNSPRIFCTGRGGSSPVGEPCQLTQGHSAFLHITSILPFTAPNVLSALLTVVPH